MAAAEQDELLSRCIVLATSRGRSSFPKDNFNILQEELPSAALARLLPACKAVFAEADAFQPDWQAETLEQAAARLSDSLHQSFPSLTTESIDALLWRFAYNWK